MKTITRYLADDGTEFTEEQACMGHEALCAEVRDLLAKLPPRPKKGKKAENTFLNGRGYIQHDAATIWQVRDGLLRIAQNLTDDVSIKRALGERVCLHPGFVFTAIDQGCPDVVSKAWVRIMCVGSTTFREYGQPYFLRTGHLSEICLNPEQLPTPTLAAHEEPQLSCQDEHYAA